MTIDVAQPATLPILSHWIDGRPAEVFPEQTGPVFNPASGEVIGRVPRGGAAEVDAAVAAAKAAFPAWRDTPLIARSQVFFAFRELIWQHREELATLITRDQGKTFPDALGEVLPETEEVGGLGLGVAVVKRIVAGHGGQVLVEAGPGNTTLRVRLPARRTY